MSKPVFILLLFLSFTTGLQAQADPSSPFLVDPQAQPTDYQKLYDYSKMGDTLITEYGNTDLNGSNFQPKTGNGLCCFAKREITVRKGKLKEVHILDTNTGIETTITYGKKGEKTKQRVNNAVVRNTPPYR